MKVGKLGIILCGIFASALITVSTAKDDELRWLDSYSDALREARRTRKPIFLEFRCEP